MAAPAAIASAVNNALKPLGGKLHHLPIRLPEIAQVLAWAEKSESMEFINPVDRIDRGT